VAFSPSGGDAYQKGVDGEVDQMNATIRRAREYYLTKGPSSMGRINIEGVCIMAFWSHCNLCDK
jgi:hypothetical protein